MCGGIAAHVNKHVCNFLLYYTHSAKYADFILIANIQIK